MQTTFTLNDEWWLVATTGDQTWKYFPFTNDFRVVVVLVELRPIAIFIFKKCTKEIQELNLVSNTDFTFNAGF